MPEYQAPTLDNILNKTSLGVGLGTSLATGLGSAASGLMGATMAGLLSNPFTAVGAALLPLAGKLFGPGADGPRMVGATNIVEAYEKELKSRLAQYQKLVGEATPEQKAQFAANQEALIQEMFDTIRKYPELKDIGTRSIAERNHGGKYDFYSQYVNPVTGGKSATDYAKSLGVQTSVGSTTSGVTTPDLSDLGTSGSLPTFNLSNFLGGANDMITTNFTATGGGSAAGGLGNILSSVLGSIPGILSKLGGILSPGGVQPGNTSSNQNSSNSSNWLTALLGLIPAGTSLGGALAERGSNDAANAALQEAIAGFLSRGDQLVGQGSAQQEQLMQLLLPLIQAGGGDQAFSDLQTKLSEAGTNIPALFGQNLADPAAIAQMLQAIQDPRIQGALTSASNQVAAGGSNPALDAITSGGLGLLGGGTADQNSLRDLAASLTANGGVTPFLETLMGASEDALASHGMTPEMQAALPAFLQKVLSGGKTAENQALFDRGMELYNREALLPMSTAVSFARDQAGRTISQQAEAARREAQQRGGGPGAVVGAGSANDARAAFADDAAALVADAVQKTMLSQQGLQLQQQAAGLQGATSGASLMNQLFGEGASGLGNILQTAASRESSLGQLGAGAQAQATDRTNIGGNLIQALLGSMVQGGSLAGNAQNTIAQRLATALGSVSNLGQLQLGGFNDIVKNLLEGSQLGIQQGTAISNAQNQNLDTLSRNEISRLSNLTNLLGIIESMSKGNLATGTSAWSNAGSLFNPLAQSLQNSPLADWLKGPASSAAGDITQIWKPSVPATPTTRNTSTSLTRGASTFRGV